ncbi:MAG: hypothetical protein AB7N71_00145 [Phycisphaerae bacterium]
MEHARKSIQVKENVYEALERLAAAAGLSLEQWLESRIADEAESLAAIHKGLDEIEAGKAGILADDVLAEIRQRFDKRMS